VLTCPSDEPNAPIATITSHNYVVNHGNTHISYGVDPPGSFQGVSFKGSPFAPRIAVKFLEITDGLSTTLLLAEVRQGQRHDLRGFSWWGQSAAFTTFFPPNTTAPDANIYGPGEANGYCDPLPPNPPCVRASTAYPMVQSARSRHPQGVNVVHGDGSVRFVSNNVNLQTWRNLGSTLDGEVLGDY
jgi:prepilin-type processing-associated H-X9-DG protein